MNKEEWENYKELSSEITEKLDNTAEYESWLIIQEYIDRCQQENQKLKKQLENCYCNRTDCSSRIKDSKKYDSLVQKVENQQKEFIEWLENEIKECDAYSKYIKKKVKELKPRRLGKTYLTVQMMKNEIEKECYKDSLSKYKEIIGGKNV